MPAIQTSNELKRARDIYAASLPMPHPLPALLGDFSDTLRSWWGQADRVPTTTHGHRLSATPTWAGILEDRGPGLPQHEGRPPVRPRRRLLKARRQPQDIGLPEAPADDLQAHRRVALGKSDGNAGRRVHGQIERPCQDPAEPHVHMLAANYIWASGHSFGRRRGTAMVGQTR